MLSILIINSIIWAVGTVAGLLFAGASIISIANMQVPWRGALLVAALLIPVAFAGSEIGAWWRMSAAFRRLASV